MSIPTHLQGVYREFFFASPCGEEKDKEGQRRTKKSGDALSRYGGRARNGAVVSLETLSSLKEVFGNYSSRCKPTAISAPRVITLRGEVTPVPRAITLRGGETPAPSVIITLRGGGAPALRVITLRGGDAPALRVIALRGGDAPAPRAILRFGEEYAPARVAIS